MEETEFVKHLHEEKLKAQETRAMYTEKKLAYVTALLGVGTVSLAAFEVSAILYVVPFVAAAFDLYILSEDYSIKRIGAYLGIRSKDDMEREWEKWVHDNRDPFAPTAMLILSLLLLVGAGMIIWIASDGPNVGLLIGWAIPALFVNFGLYFLYKGLRNQVRERAKSLNAPTTTK